MQNITIRELYWYEGGWWLHIVVLHFLDESTMKENKEDSKGERKRDMKILSFENIYDIK